ncbi:MAG: protein-tyrosine phosphatase [Pseudohongiellaceae bacterium]|jgi:protein-tyrosine phosphatase
MPELSRGVKQPVRILMVCLGNICRSPTAHGVLEKLVRDRGLSDWVLVDSAGTADFHVGKQPDSRASAAAALRGYDLNHLRARQVDESDFDNFDFIFAMDRQNLRNLENLQPIESKAQLKLFLQYTAVDADAFAVPDPYYSGDDGFELVLDLVESACTKLLDRLVLSASETAEDESKATKKAPSYGN